MIKALARRSDGKYNVLIGLSRENCQQLLDDKPIHVNGFELGLSHDILIIAGETEESIRDELISHGMMTEKTVTRYSGSN